MLEIIPAIDLLNGKCVRLYQGDYEQSQIFDEYPFIIAKKWEQEGATRLHLVDLDGAKAGEPRNLEAIATIIQSISIPVQVGGGIRNQNTVKQLFDIGVERVILGTIAVEKPELVAELCHNFPGKIVVGIDARNGKVATKGWLETSSILATDLAQQMEKLGVASIIYTDIHRDGTLSGPNLEALRELTNIISIPIIASGGVSSITDLLNLLTLANAGVKGVIIGKALYTEDILLKDAIRAVGSGRWQDIPPDLGTVSLA